MEVYTQSALRVLALRHVTLYRVNCLSRTILACEIPYKKTLLGGLFGVLSVRALVSFLQMPDSQISLSADIVHLIADWKQVLDGWVVEKSVGSPASFWRMDYNK